MNPEMAARQRWSLRESGKSQEACCTVLRDVIGLDAAQAEQVQACFAAAVSDEIDASIDAFALALRESLSDCGLPDDEDGMAEEVVRRLRRVGLIIEENADADAPPLHPGAQVLALLAEDDAWHEAVVERAFGDGRFQVVFTEYAKPQEVTADCIIRIDDVVPDDDEAGPTSAGECEMCTRVMPLTFHHLIPRETHGKYINKALPEGVEGEPTRVFLNHHGMMVCRQCHTHIHRLMPNDALAARLNTKERVLADPSVQRHVEFACRQKVRHRWHR